VGGMVRATVYEESVRLKWLNAKFGIAFDTGTLVSGDNLEVKILGNGLKVGKDGIQICIFLCFGVSW
jgi:hypothetical protein